MATGRHLEKWIWRHSSAEGGSILTKLRRSMQNDTLMSKIMSKLKPEIEFQYSGRPFSDIRSSFISAVDWDISSKFGLLLDLRLLKWVQSPNLNPEVDFQLYGCHLEKSIWRHNSAAFRPITTKFGRQVPNDTPMSTHGTIWIFQNGVRPFPKPEVVISQPWIEIFYRNLV